MLIIFDLDDTLVDTSGCLTPVKLEKALEAMLGAGLQVESREGALDTLLRLDRKAESATHALTEFLEILEADPHFLKMGEEIVYGEMPPDTPLFTLDYVLETLQELQENHQLALVTVGVEEQQRKKMEKAGIDSTIFSRMSFLTERNKKPHYEKILEELGYPPQDVVVCGDRLAIDLAPAKELGCVTVHMRWGRGLHQPRSVGTEREADFSITQFRQIRDIVAKYYDNK